MKTLDFYYKAGKEAFYNPELNILVDPKDVRFVFIGKTGRYARYKNGKRSYTPEAPWYTQGQEVPLFEDGEKIKDLVWSKETKEDLKDRDYKYELIIYGVSRGTRPVRFVLTAIGRNNLFDILNNAFARDGSIPVLTIADLIKTKHFGKYKAPQWVLQYESRPLTDKEKEMLKWFEEKYPRPNKKNNTSNQQGEPRKINPFADNDVKQPEQPDQEVIEEDIEDDDIPF